MEPRGGTTSNSSAAIAAAIATHSSTSTLTPNVSPGVVYCASRFNFAGLEFFNSNSVKISVVAKLPSLQMNLTRKPNRLCSLRLCLLSHESAWSVLLVIIQSINTVHAFFKSKHLLCYWNNFSQHNAKSIQIETIINANKKWTQCWLVTFFIGRKKWYFIE